MSKLLRSLLLITACSALLVVAGGAAKVSAATYPVQITHASFTPTDRYIVLGDTVTWTNADSVNHQIASSSGFNSPVLGPGQSYSFTFKSAGSFAYHDSLSNLKGKVIVQVVVPTGDVGIYHGSFKPSTKTINPGESVTWYNADSSNHQVVASDGSWASPILGPGQTYSKTFPSSGSFAYKDGFYPAHTGKVNVANVVSLAGATSTVVFGQSDVLSGKVSSGQAGQTINLYQSLPGPNVYVSQTVTGPGGAFSFTVTPTVNASYAVTWGGKTSNTVAVNVSPKMTFLPVAGSNFKRFALTVNGGSSYFTGRLFHIQGFYQGQWVNLKTLRVGANGTCTFPRPRVSTVSSFRLEFDDAQVAPSFLGGHSGTQHIRFR